MTKDDRVESFVQWFMKQAKKDGVECDEWYVREQFATQYEEDREMVRNEDWSYSANYHYHIYLHR